MEWKRVLLSLFILGIAVNHGEVSGLSTKNSASVYLEKWFNNLISGWIPRSSSSFNRKSSLSESPLIESSIKSEEEILLSSRQYSGCSCACGNCATTCTSLSSQCFRTCTITSVFQSSAYSTATFTSYSVISFSFAPGVTSYFVSTLYTTSTLYVPSSTTYSTGCATVTACCTATALAYFAGAAAVAIAVGVAVPLGTPTPVIESPPDIEILSFNNPMPENLNPSPGNFPDDGCGTSSGRFGGGEINLNRQINGRNSIGINKRQSKQKNGNRIKIKRQNNRGQNFGNIRNQTDGCNNKLFNNAFNNCTNNCTRQKDENAIRKDRENDENWIRIHGTWNFTDNRNNCTQLDGECHQLLSNGPCENPRQWFTLDPGTLMGRCTPRLCGRGRVFVGETGLCHDSEDPNICKGGRKLFYTAYGDPICDCPVGEYPFPGELDECVGLFTRGPCPFGQVVAFGQAGDNLQCTPSQCPFNGNVNVPLVPFEDGRCYPLGSQGPCRSQPFQLLGYDVFERRTLCVNVTAIGSPYFELNEEIDILDENYNQLLPEFDEFSRVSFLSPAGKRQGDALTAGLIQLPANFPKDPLLNPCRPGSRTGNNYKCTNPILFLGKKQRILQAVRAAFECPSGLLLQATGQCGNDARRASCGPSYQYVESIGECRAIFRP